MKTNISIIRIAFLLSFLLPALSQAQVSTFPYAEGFENTFTTGLNVQFLPNWTGNEVQTSTRIFRDGTNQQNGTGALAVIPISSFTADIVLDLNFSSLNNAMANFSARTIKNSTGTRPALVNFSTSIDGGTSYTPATLIGSAVAFPNATTPFAPYSYNFASNTNGQALVKLKITVAQSPDSTGTTARFVLDDFSISGTVVNDTIPPTLSTVTVISGTQLDVKFSEPVTQATAQNTSNYSVNNGIGNPISAVRDAIDFSLVHLTFGSAFIPNTSYIITASSISDLAGNILSFSSGNFNVSQIQSADVIISEIMADPDPVVGLPNFEYLELYNKTTNAINLTNWTLTAGSTVKTFGNISILPDSFLIVCTATAASSLSVFGPVASILTSSTTLTNGGITLVLKNAGGLVINQVSYSDTWYVDPSKKDGGWSLEIINLTLPCSNAGNWRASIDPSGGTPGKRNSINNTAPDTTPPTLLSATVIDTNKVVICFSESVDSTQAANINNYNINPFVGSPLSVLVAGPLFNCATLTLPFNIDSVNTYTATVSNIGDCSGNMIAPNSFINYSVGFAGDFLDVIINEIMADPDPVVGLPNYEYLELYNRTANTVALNNWTLTHGTTVKTFTNINMPAHSYLILCTATAAGELAQFGPVTPILTSSTALTNAGTSLSLRNAGGKIIHALTYSDSWYVDGTKKDGGWSLERIDPDFPCSNPMNWRASVAVAGGTPGSANSVVGFFNDTQGPKLLRASLTSNTTVRLFFNEPLDTLGILNPALYSIDNALGNPVSVALPDVSFTIIDLTLSAGVVANKIYTVTVNASVKDCKGNGVALPARGRFALADSLMPNDVVINEILFNPYTGGSDFVELYNRSQKFIQLAGTKLASASTDNGSLTSIKDISNEGYMLFPGEYVVLSVSPDNVKANYQTPNPDAFINMSSMPSFNNDKGYAVFLNNTAVRIDEFSYTEKMHYPLLTSVKGVSLERINPNRATQDITNWHSAAQQIGFATPGYRNSQYSETISSGGTLSIEPEIFSPDNDGVSDVVNMHYTFNAPGYVMSVNIYDARGRLIRQLVRNELQGESGVVSWDGITDGNEKARIGVYVVMLEAFHTNGNIEKIKKPVVVAGKL